MTPTNEPAFPSNISNDMNTLAAGLHAGMTLRDYFAGQVLPSWALVKDAKDCAIKCYEYADAMLAERNK